MKSDSPVSALSSVIVDGVILQDQSKISNAFNKWFNNIKSNDLNSPKSCEEFVDNIMHDAIRSNKLKQVPELFSFEAFKLCNIEDRLRLLSSCHTSLLINLLGNE
jgi:hypothetical protein